MYLLFDIGATQTRLAFSKTGRTVQTSTIFATPQNYNQGMKMIAEQTQKLTKGQAIKAAAGGIAGPLNQNKSKIIGNSKIRDWSNRDLKKSLKTIVKAPVLIENDADLAGLGEANFGAGMGKSIVAYLTISTGIGGTRIVNGKIDQSYLGFEPGSQIIDMYSKKDLEDFISGYALKNKYNKLPIEITAANVWKKQRELLAIGLNNLIVFWSPEVIVIGGGIMQNSNMSIVKIRQEVKKRLKVFKTVPQIKKAQLGELSGIYGALVLLNN